MPSPSIVALYYAIAEQTKLCTAMPPHNNTFLHNATALPNGDLLDYAIALCSKAI